MLDAGGGEDVELQVAQEVVVYCGQGEGEVDDGVDDGLDEEGGVAGFAEDGAGGAETGDDGALYVVGGGFEEGNDGVVVAEEDGDLFGGDGHVVLREGGVALHEVGAGFVA